MTFAAYKVVSLTGLLDMVKWGYGVFREAVLTVDTTHGVWQALRMALQPCPVAAAPMAATSNALPDPCHRRGVPSFSASLASVQRRPARGAPAGGSV